MFQISKTYTASTFTTEMYSDVYLYVNLLFLLFTQLIHFLTVTLNIQREVYFTDYMKNIFEAYSETCE